VHHFLTALRHRAVGAKASRRFLMRLGHFFALFFGGGRRFRRRIRSKTYGSLEQGEKRHTGENINNTMTIHSGIPLSWR
jgi:hypothetical protein